MRTNDSRALLLFILLWPLPIFLTAQNICPPTQPPADICSGATSCIYCNLNGFTGSTAGYNSNTAQGFCDNLEHDQWLGFLAPETGNANIKITASNCQNGDGLQAAIYETCTQSPVVCNPGQNGGGNIPITLNTALTPGKTYYLMIDSRNGDQCQYTIASNPPDSFKVIGGIHGPDYIFPNSQQVYNITPVSGASFYKWTAPQSVLINGQTSPVLLPAATGTHVTVTFGEQGGALCVTPQNACVNGVTTCLDITLAPYTSPCATPPPPPGANNCSNACVLCSNLNGFTGTNYGTADSSYYICGQIAVQNNQWFGFIPGTDCMTINVKTTNCQQGEGLQVAFFENCTDDALVCNPGGLGGAGQPLVLSYCDFVPGRSYFLMIDGFIADVCDYQIEVLEGSAIAPPIGPLSLEIAGPATICPGGTATYRINRVYGASAYAWSAPPGCSINGQSNHLVTTDSTITVQFGNLGGTICVSASNACSVGNSAVCKTITIEPLLPTVLPSITICNNELPYSLPWGQKITSSGTYQASIPGYLGCDSIVRQQVTVLPPINTNLPTMAVCAGETIEMCGNTYGASGTYAAVCQAANGCDSTINFELKVLNPVADIQGGGNLNCTGNQVSLTSGPSNGIKTWYNESGQIIGTGNALSVSQTGVYTLRVTETLGAVTCSASDTISITNNGTNINVTAAGATLTCSTPSISITCTADAPNPIFAWIGPNGFISNQQNPIVTEPGDYQVTVTNPAGCSGTATVTVLQDNVQPIVTAENALLNCYQPTGNILASASVPNTTFVWTKPNGEQVASANLFVSAPGVYTVVGTAPNGCTGEKTPLVTADYQAPVSTVDQFGILGCGGPITLICNTNATNPLFSWTGPQGFSATIAAPQVTLPGTYTVVVLNTNNGCRDSVSYIANLSTATGCASACVSCTGIDGYVGTNNGTPSGGNIVCGQIVIHNDQWIGFTAGTEAIKVNVATTNCLTGDGLQIAFFENCDDDAIVCNPGAGGSAGLPLELSYSSFIPGHTYYLMIDGWVADVCDYEIQVVEGSTAAPDLGPIAAQPSGPATVCQGGLASYQVPEVAGASYYLWTAPAGSSINGQGNTVYSSSNMVEISFGTNSGNVCVTAGSACQTSPNIACLAVSVTTTQPTVLPKISVCSSELPYTLPWGASVNASGIYQNTFTSLNGCDSVVSQEVKVLFPVVTNLAATVLCSGESMQVCGTSYSASGNYSVTCLSVAGCDSIINFSVQVLNPVAHILGGGSLNCAASPITLSAEASQGVKLWRKLGDNQVLGTGNSIIVSDTGTYELTVNQSLGGVICSVSDTITISKTGTEIGVVTGSATLTCFASAVTLPCMVNALDPVFEWSGPNNFSSNLQNPQTTAPGTYQVQVTNAQGCSGTALVVVNQDITPPDVSVTNGHIDCAHPIDTLHAGSTITGVIFMWGAPPNGLPHYGPDVVVSQAGSYTVIATAPNGCINTATGVVTEDLKSPAAIIQQDGILGCGNSVTLNGSSDLPAVMYYWNGPGGYNSTYQNIVVNVQGLYHLTVRNPENGCSDSSQVSVLRDATPPSVAILSHTDPVIGQNNGSIQLSVPSGQSVTFKWYKNGILFANTQNVANLGPGTYICVVTGLNGCESNISIILTGITSTQTPDQNLQWKVFPNPSAGLFSIRCNGSTTPDALLNLYDASGRLCWTNEHPQPAPEVLDFEHFPAGLYHLEIRTDKVVVQKKLEIIR
ncbi:MAG: T9SS type A sorting domain-containing protein [Bacteroidota bacterium]